MEIRTFNYTQEQGWSDKFPALDSPKTLIIIFGAPEYFNNKKPIDDLVSAFPQSTIIGCSTAGEILNSTIQDSSISVAVAKFRYTDLAEISTEVKSIDDSFEAGKYLADQFRKENLRGIFLLSDGLNINGSHLIKGLNSVLSEKVIVTGGLAGDGAHFKKTWVMTNKKLKSNYVTAVGFYGDRIRIGYGSRGGWDSFGPERIITKSKNNILYELDNKPALALYKEYLGDYAKGLPAAGLLFPLAIRENSEDSSEIVRTILAVDEGTQSLQFAGDVPIGYLAQLMRANFDRLITAANEAALATRSMQEQTIPILAVAISCVGRRLLLGEYAEEETESTLESLPKGTQQIGFYSYGEISAFSTGHCDLHNQSMTLTTFSEVS